MVPNTLVGIALGDAFGTSLYHPDRNWLKNQEKDDAFFCHYHHRVVVSEHEDSIWSYRGYKPGHYTDTTEMTIGVVNAVLSGGHFTEQLLISKWREEYDKTKLFKNGVGRAGYGTIALFFEGKQDLETIKSGQANRKYPGNAPPMRAVPLGFLPEKLINIYATVNANATHPHPKSTASSIVIARATQFLLIKNGNKSEVISYCLPYIQGVDEETTTYLSNVDQLGPEPDLAAYELLCGQQPTVSFPEGIYGLPSDAMRLAGVTLYILKHATDTFDGLKRAISFGGDVGTLSPVVVGILSGKNGLQSLPEALLEGVENREQIIQKGLQFANYLSSLN